MIVKLVRVTILGESCGTATRDRRDFYLHLTSEVLHLTSEVFLDRADSPNRSNGFLAASFNFKVS
jgi:hypothetical protein